MIKDFLPVSRSDMEKRGWEQCDFVYITGDAYVDHSSFGHAIISSFRIFWIQSWYNTTAGLER